MSLKWQVKFEIRSSEKARTEASYLKFLLKKLKIISKERNKSKTEINDLEKILGLTKWKANSCNKQANNN